MTTELHSDLFQRIRFHGRPLANPESIVVSGNARFTMLTSRLIRLEWSEAGGFEDRGTYAFPTRYAPAPSFSTEVQGRVLEIDTGALRLHYALDSGKFTATNLSVSFELNGRRQTWVPGLPNPLNLCGTRRTLDSCEGDAALEEGLLSRAGWSLFDDSQAVLFGPGDGWVLPPRTHEVQDWYFFGYGHDYKAALAEYTHFGGPVPLIPRYLLGAWWSRYWSYSAQDLRDLVHEFEEHDVPLDVLVVDMDWHTPHSWTGYTWNRRLFPDPPAFLRWVHDRGLHVALNLHPAEGVQPFEEVYPRFAVAMGIDPDAGEVIPFRIADRKFVQNYFELLHHPLEDDGVDFWWVDWQQGETSEMGGLDPLPWLNHLHFADSARLGLRPVLYSRWGGLGNHRYPTGFSGDTWVGWQALQFQPYFTATAANVAYGWWGHDIGGHMGGATEPELYARWVQFGALSPILRLHATKDPLAERRPWCYPEAVYQATRAAFHWRYQLVPYIYTMARIAHETGMSLCRPMYYEYPEDHAAYSARTQYFFGDQMIAAPIVQPADPETGLASTDVWVPPGTWVEYTTRETFTGPRWVRLIGDLDRVPMLMRAGAILPLAAPFDAPSPGHLASGTTGAIPRDRLLLAVFPGAPGTFRLYEDDGLTTAYEDGQYEWTEITTRSDSPDTWVVHIAPIEGRCVHLPERRGYEIRLEGCRRPESVLVNGAQAPDWSYDPEVLRTTIRVSPRDKGQALTVSAMAKGGISALGETHNRHCILSDVERLVGKQLPAGLGDEGVLDALLRTGSPGRVDAIARLGGPLVRFIEYTTPEEASQQLGRVIVGAPSRPGEPFDLEVLWTLWQGRDRRQQALWIEGATEPQILDAPFAFDGRVLKMRWTAEARVTWRGETLVFIYQSSPLFPSIDVWQVVFYDQDEAPLTVRQVMGAGGSVNRHLDWKAYVQTPEGVRNVNQPHVLFLAREAREELRAGARLAAYLATSISSPDERDAVVQFRSAGPTAFYLNGQAVVEDPVEQEGWPSHPLRRARSTGVMRLRPGRNWLLVHSQPFQEKRSWWYFEGALLTPEGELMTDLGFEVDVLST